MYTTWLVVDINKCFVATKLLLSSINECKFIISYLTTNENSLKVV